MLLAQSHPSLVDTHPKALLLSKSCTKMEESLKKIRRRRSRRRRERKGRKRIRKEEGEKAEEK